LENEISSLPQQIPRKHKGKRMGGEELWGFFLMKDVD